MALPNVRRRAVEPRQGKGAAGIDDGPGRPHAPADAAQAADRRAHIVCGAHGAAGDARSVAQVLWHRGKQPGECAEHCDPALCRGHGGRRACGDEPPPGRAERSAPHRRHAAHLAAAVPGGRIPALRDVPASRWRRVGRAARDPQRRAGPVVPAGARPHRASL